MHVTSRYNFCIPAKGGLLLYNTSSGAVLKLSGNDAREFSRALSEEIAECEAEDLPPALAEALFAGKFIVPSGTDELAEIRERFQTARGVAPMVLTLTATMNCNLGCYYCYEKRSAERLGAENIGSIVQETRVRLALQPAKGLHVDWYGGEPTLNLEFIEEASQALQKLCKEIGAPYSASIISNGTAWPADVEEFIKRNRIREVQISFDGLRENHNVRRHLRPSFTGTLSATPFDLAVHLVDRLLNVVQVDLRFNTDRGNSGDLLDFVKFGETRGWFGRAFRAVLQPARLASYSERSAFMRKSELSVVEFDELRGQLRRFAAKDIAIEESEAPDGFPYPKTSVCAALARRSFVVGADGRHYRCGLQVGEAHRAVGRIDHSAPSESYPDASWWDAFDPTILPSCSRCSFLPVCWGGCPKKHLEKDQHALDETSIYWRKNLARLVASHMKQEVAPDFEFTEADQFRC